LLFLYSPFLLSFDVYSTAEAKAGTAVHSGLFKAAFAVIWHIDRQKHMKYCLITDG